MKRRPPGLEMALLGFLREKPQHGYNLYRLASDRSGLGAVWNLKQSQLYALLAKLEKDGLIEGKLEFQENAHPPRRTYRLTRSGRTAYQNWLKSPVQMPRYMRQEFMAKYYFASQEGNEKTAELVRSQQTVCLKWLEKLNYPKVKPSPFSQTIYRYRSGQIQAILAWLDSCQEGLQKKNF